MKALLLLLLSGAALYAGTPSTVTFYRDVLPVLQERCQGCHRPGEVGPMAFGAYDQTRPWAKAIKQAVLLGKMPPWYADTPPGRFHNDPRLSRQEIAKLVAWSDAGAPAGDPKDAPRPLTFPQGWTIDQPDAVFQVPTPFQIPATGTLEYTYVIVPTGFKEDRWITQWKCGRATAPLCIMPTSTSANLARTGFANTQSVSYSYPRNAENA